MKRGDAVKRFMRDEAYLVTALELLHQDADDDAISTTFAERHPEITGLEFYLALTEANRQITQGRMAAPAASACSGSSMSN